MLLTKKNETQIIKRKNKLLPYLALSIFILTLLSAVTYVFVRYIKISNKDNSVQYIYEQWNKHNYQEVFTACNTFLSKQPFNNTALTFKGYSAFYLAVSQTDFSAAREYLDYAIFNIRVALQTAKKTLKPQLNYMLGKTYFYKNTLSSYYYYADLAVHYLTTAQKLGYKSDDIYEYLGLSYASLGMTAESISAFTEALLVRESDSLLLSIAEQYHKAAQNASAKQYLYRVIQQDTNENLVVKSRLLLGQIYLEEDDLVSAQKEFQTIIEKNVNSADAYYGLGVIYEKQGDLVKARSEWRKVLSVQINHPGALKKISDYK